MEHLIGRSTPQRLPGIQVTARARGALRLQLVCSSMSARGLDLCGDVLCPAPRS